MKKYLLLVVMFLGLTVEAQKELNAYKYIVIPSQFDFQKEANEYGVNLLLKYKFQQLGFETYLDTDDLPQEVLTNTCLSVYPVLHAKSNMFKTIVSIELFDCTKKSLYITQEGSSNSKNTKVSYNESIREALNSFQGYKLEFAPVEKNNVIADSVMQSRATDKNDVKNNEDVMSVKEVIFSDEGNVYKLIKKSLMFFEIQNVKTKEIIGEMIASGFKKGVFHIKFNDEIGFCYYGENGNLIMEFLSSDNSVQMKSYYLK